MKYLTNHESGFVISEQKRLLKENDECEPDFELLVRELKNGWHGDKYRWLPEESYNFRYEDQDDDSYVVLVPKMKTLLPKINFERNKIYLQGDGKIFRVFKNKRHPFGNWCYKPSPKGNDEMELFINTTRNPDKDEKTADATTATNTTTDVTTTTNTTTDATTTNNTQPNKENQKGTLIKPFKEEIKLCNDNVSETFCMENLVGGPIVSPVDGEVVAASDSGINIEFFDNGQKLTIMLVTDDGKTTPMVSEGEKVVKGKTIGSIVKNAGLYGVIQKEDYTNVQNVLEWFI
jgi:biotin carboxyl carrier protein